MSSMHRSVASLSSYQLSAAPKQVRIVQDVHTIALENRQILFDNRNEFLATPEEELCIHTLADRVHKARTGNVVISSNVLFVRLDNCPVVS